MVCGCGCGCTNINNTQQKKTKQPKINVEYSVCVQKKWIAIIFYETCLACASREPPERPTKITWKRNNIHTTKQNTKHDREKKCSSTQSRMALVVFIEASFVCGVAFHCPWYGLWCASNSLSYNLERWNQQQQQQKTQPFIDLQ